jgi:predicted PurR-regulated permease PerM
MVLVEAVTHLIDNVVFQPVIFSNSVKAHPLEIFVVVLIAGFAAGIPGMLLGIPAYTVLRVFAREFFYGFKAVQRITSSLSDESPPVVLKTEFIPADQNVKTRVIRKRVSRKTKTSESGDE